MKVFFKDSWHYLYLVAIHLNQSEYFNILLTDWSHLLPLYCKFLSVTQIFIFQVRIDFLVTVSMPLILKTKTFFKKKKSMVSDKMDETVKRPGASGCFKLFFSSLNLYRQHLSHNVEYLKNYFSLPLFFFFFK